MNKELEKEIKKSSSIQQFLKKLDSGKADQSDVSLYGADLGQCAANVINSHIRKDMTWTELNDMAMPIFKEVYDKVNDAAFTIQKAEDKKNKIGVNPVKADFPEDKIHDLIYKIFEYLRQEEDNGD